MDDDATEPDNPHAEWSLTLEAFREALCHMPGWAEDYWRVGPGKVGYRTLSYAIRKEGRARGYVDGEREAMDPTGLAFRIARWVATVNGEDAADAVINVMRNRTSD